MFSHFSVDQQVVGFHQNMHQCTHKGKGGEDFRLVNMDMNLSGLELQHEEGKAFNVFGFVTLNVNITFV